ncbi:MAG: hypothetical protein ACKV19_11730 [Verrucomicrobiales bacterium]
MKAIDSQKAAEEEGAYQAALKECNELRESANNWSDEERERLGEEMMSFFYGTSSPSQCANSH